VGAHLVLVQHELARVVVLTGVATKPTSGQLKQKFIQIISNFVE
jgi:hypothetical protein